MGLPAFPALNGAMGENEVKGYLGLASPGANSGRAKKKIQCLGSITEVQARSVHVVVIPHILE